LRGCLFTEWSTSNAFLEEDEKRSLYNSPWFDFYFPGSRKLTIWNANICTAWWSFWEDVEGLAYEKAYLLLSDEEWENEKMPYEKIWPQFGNMTLRDYTRQAEREIIANEPPAVYESFKINREFVFGIGLNIIVETKEITRSVIEKAIDKFMSIGETNWRSESPVPRECLPYKTRGDTTRKIFSRTLRN
jgi:hypothetical protein